MTFKFNRVLTVVKVHVHAKFRRAKCSGSWVIVVTEKQTPTKTYTYYRPTAGRYVGQ